MKTIKLLAVMFGLAGTLASPVLGQSNAYTSMVSFSLKALDGSAQGRTLTIAPDGDGPESYWNDLFWGPALTATPTNGVATVWLAPDDYVATLAGCQGSIAFTVGTNLGVFNVLDLATNVPGYLGAMAGPATVVFQVRTLSGAAPTRSLTIAQVKPGPLTNGTNIVWGASLARSATNGLLTLPLEPQGYTADLSGGAVGELTFYVPTDGGTYNVASLPSVMPLPSLAPVQLPTPTMSIQQTNRLIECSAANNDVGGALQLYGYVEQYDQFVLLATVAWTNCYNWSPVAASNSGTYAFWASAEVPNGTTFTNDDGLDHLRGPLFSIGSPLSWSP